MNDYKNDNKESKWIFANNFTTKLADSLKCQHLEDLAQMSFCAVCWCEKQNKTTKFQLKRYQKISFNFLMHKKSASENIFLHKIFVLS